jgi:hypothetical protein
MEIVARIGGPVTSTLRNAITHSVSFGRPCMKVSQVTPAMPMKTNARPRSAINGDQRLARRSATQPNSSGPAIPLASMIAPKFLPVSAGLIRASRMR